MGDIERKLDELTCQFEEIKVSDQATHYMTAGVRKAQQYRHKRRRWKPAILVAVLIIFLFISSIKISPAFADYMGKVPGLSYIVQMIGDKGLQAAVQNHFVQELNLSKTDNGTTISIDSMIADGNQINLFYTIKSSHFQKNQQRIKNFTLQNTKGESVIGTAVSDFSPLSKQEIKKGVIHDRITISFNKKQLTNPLVLHLEALSQKWTFNIPYNIDKLKRLKHVYTIHRTVTLHGQKITFDTVTIYPTRVAIRVKYASTNSLQIMHLNDLRLVDDKGNEWASINNGVTEQAKSDNERTIYLQSNFFAQSKAIYLKLNSARAVDKRKDNLIIDLNKKKMLQAPDDRLQLNKVSKDDKDIRLDFTLTKPNSQQRINFFALDYKFHDGSGKTYQQEEKTVMHGMKGKDQFSYYIPNKHYTNPIIFQITDYPTTIHGNVTIQVK